MTNKPPQRGDSLQQISATGLRAAFRAGEAFDRGELKAQRQNQRAVRNNPGAVFVLNDSRVDVPRFGVIGLDSPLDTSDETAFAARSGMRAVKPNVGFHFESFGIAQHPIKDGATGLVIISGLTKCLIKIPNEADHYTRASIITDNVEHLHINPAGPLTVIWKDSTPLEEGGDIYLAVAKFDQVPQDWILVGNTHNTEAPPYCVFELNRISGAFVDGFRPTTSMAMDYAVNGPVPIPRSEFTYAYVGSSDVYVKLDYSATPALNANWGPIKDRWYIAEANADGESSYGYRTDVVLRHDAGQNRRVLCRRVLPRELKVKAVDTIEPDAEGLVTVWEGGVETERTIMAALNWMHGGSPLLSDVDAVARLQQNETSGELGWHLFQRSAVALRKATTFGSAMLAGTSADVTLKNEDPDADVETVVAHLDWMHNDEDISSDTQILIAWFDDEKRWVVIGAECEIPPEA